MTSPDRAVVIGASIGGLLAARALSDHFRRVTIIDRDTLPAEATIRRAVPQARHLHGLLALGSQTLDELFPGFTDEMVAQGALWADMKSDIHWWNDGHLLNPEPSGLLALAASRPLLEFNIRRRIAALAGVEIVADCEVLGLVAAGGNHRITGVTILPRSDGAASSVIDAALVVDASGRGSRTPGWLAGLGFAAPEEDKIPINVTYVSRLYRRERRHLDGRLGTAAPSYPGSPNAAMILAQENDTFILTTSGILGYEPPMDDEGLLEFAGGLASDDFTDLVQSATRLTEPVKMRYPRSVRRRYERLTSFPEGYLVVADALCSFNPVYGQGMTVAATEARLLGRLLSAGRDRLAPRFFAEAAKLIDVPWAIAAGADLRFEEVEGIRPPGAEDMNNYLARLHVVAEHDHLVATAFIRVLNLLDDPAQLLAPEIMARVLGEAAAVA